MLLASKKVRSRLGKAKSVEVRLFAPEKNGKDWNCQFEIIGPDMSYKVDNMGVDQFQALNLAMRAIEVLLETKAELKPLRLIKDLGRGGFGFWMRFDAEI